MDEIQPELTIVDIETLKLIADERRLAILRLLRRPRTVKELAEELGESPTKLYYHINLLEQRGLLRVVATSVVSGIVEKTYQVAARQLRFRNPLLAGDQLAGEQTMALLGSLLDDTRDELARAHAALTPPADGGPPQDFFVTKKAVRLTPARLAALHTRLAALIQELDAIDAEDDGGESFRLTLAFYRYLPEH
jgi:DNA-binding transcriptional ArsR family regulator